MDLRKQLEEIQILQCSLLPRELFAFVLPQDDIEEWTQLLHNYIQNGTTPRDRDGDCQPASTCRFEVRVQDVPLWFEIELPRGYPERGEPLVYVRGEKLERGEQERWQEVARERLVEMKTEGADFIVQNLLCLHLIPLLHESAQSLQSAHPKSQSHPSSTHPTSSQPASTPSSNETYHALLTSHHLISPTKRRSLQKWTAELSLHGFAKVGYPGAIYVEGVQADVAEFVSRVKAMQWLALRVRFEEKLDGNYGRLSLGDENGYGKGKQKEKQEGEARGKWVELEKVGEVVDVMRRSGREEFVTEMGLGSASSAPASQHMNRP